MSDIVRLSDASSLALHAMALLAYNRGKRISAAKMAELFGASKHTLEKVLQTLVRAKMIDSTRGPHGGFSLLRDPESLSLLDIHEAVEGTLCPPTCLLVKPVCKGKSCLMGGLLNKVHKELANTFRQTKLKTLAEALDSKAAIHT